MSTLRQTFASFDEYCVEHVEPWGVDVDLPFVNAYHFAHYIDEVLLPNQRISEIQDAFRLLDKLFLAGDEATRDLIGIGVIEDLQSLLSGRVEEYSTLVPLLPQTLLKVWQQVEKQWAGKNSLIELIEAESAQPPIFRTWAQILSLPEVSSQ